MSWSIFVLLEIIKSTIVDIDINIFDQIEIALSRTSLAFFAYISYHISKSDIVEILPKLYSKAEEPAEILLN